MSSNAHPALTVHMLVSLDGKTTGSLFTIEHALDFLKEYYRIDREHFIPKSKVCLSGWKCLNHVKDLVPPEEFPALDKKGDRSDFHADVETYQLPANQHFHACVDPHGRMAWRHNVVQMEEFPFYDGDRVVEVLVEDFVTDEFLAQLRKANVPYIFAGKSALDCRLALDKLGKLFKTDTVTCLGGGTINGGFLEKGIVDKLSLVVLPVVSGDPSEVQLFNSITGSKLPMAEFDLKHVEKLANSGLWLLYNRKA